MTRLHVPSFLALMSLLLLGACATRPVNPPITQTDLRTGYRFETRQAVSQASKDNLVILAFSGGGTRAAAFSYGVLEFLRRTEIVAPNGAKFRLIDSIDVITGVSGGSFTALAYGLYGDKLFDDYEQRFLKRNVQGEIVSRAFSPRYWGDLSSEGWGRSELASQLYDEILFNGATFGDLNRGKGPMILASATDISTGSRFVFHQGTFNMIFSDLNAVPLSRAAAASSAVPVVLWSITIKNYQAAPATGARLRGRSRSSTTTTRRDLPRTGDSIAQKLASVWRQRSPALSPSRRRRRIGQRGHARRARCDGSPRSAARGRLAVAARQREKDHRLSRKFAVVTAYQLGRIL